MWFADTEVANPVLSPGSWALFVRQFVVDKAATVFAQIDAAGDEYVLSRSVLITSRGASGRRRLPESWPVKLAVSLGVRSAFERERESAF
ncbi:hypothetical protein [Streptomyces sp. NPDC005407]|uniref:hypothetical protein n=1 Tax=Streptomyces sp. NPDC005407 TaxID=3155340 RepID=UPI0033BCC5FA